MLKTRPALQYSEGRSRKWGGSKLVNCYAEKADGDKTDDFAVMATPGLTSWADIGLGSIRGSIVMDGTLYVVAGGGFYSIDAFGAVTHLGSVGGTGPVRMAANYTQVAIAANGPGYVWSGGAMHQPLLFDVSDVVYADGYILWVVKDSEQFFISSLDDALTYDWADIASVEGFPDNIIGVVNDHREIQFYGGQSTEIFYNSGAADFPFERQGNAFIERGCFDRNSIVKIDNSVTFMGEDRVIYALNGYSPQRISTHAIEYFLRDATYANAFTYTLEGHKFYCVEVDAGTFCFDRATGTWHQRQSWNLSHWRIGGAVLAYGLILLTDREGGKLYTPSNDVLTEDGEIIAVEIYLPTIEAARERVTLYSFEVFCETGVGNESAPNPQIMMTYSDDGGFNWSNEMWRSLGAVGTYRTRAVWRKLGQFRTRQIKLRITDAVRKLVISYWMDVA